MSKEICVGLLGFGEVGQALADDLHGVTGVRLYAWDRLFGSESEPDRQVQAREYVISASGAADLARKADLVISAVTASNSIPAARSIAQFLRTGSYVLDLNSVSPATKQVCADIIDGVGARYVEAAVMTAIMPGRLRTPMLLGGPHADAFMSSAQELGFTNASVFSEKLGDASATKMCRSVIVKGLEALVIESLVSARHYGVELQVLASLSDVVPIADWPAHARYLCERSTRHGARRAEEMQEAAATVMAAGIDPHMSQACAKRQEWASQFPDVPLDNLPELLDQLRRKS